MSYIFAFILVAEIILSFLRQLSKCEKKIAVGKKEEFKRSLMKMNKSTREEGGDQLLKKA